jgi:hypothetical protein
MKTTLQFLFLNSSRRFWKARTSVGHTKLKAAGMNMIISQGDAGSGLEEGLMAGRM